MENRLKKHWTEFDRMVRRLGALRLERDGLLRAGAPASCTRVVETFSDAVVAVCRFGGDAAERDGGAAHTAWEALDRAGDATRQARASLLPETDSVYAVR